MAGAMGSCFARGERQGRVLKFFEGAHHEKCIYLSFNLDFGFAINGIRKTWISEKVVSIIIRSGKLTMDDGFLFYCWLSRCECTIKWYRSIQNVHIERGNVHVVIGFEK